EEILRHPQEEKIAYDMRIFTPAYLALVASVLVLMTLGMYYLKRPSLTRIEKEWAARKHDVKAPIGNRSTLTLDDGTVFALDSLDQRLLAKYGDIQVIESETGQISYQSFKGKKDDILHYHTITNPKGSKVID